MTCSNTRSRLIELIDEATSSGARLNPSCNIVGVSCKTYRRWKLSDTKEDRRPTAIRKPPKLKLSDEERKTALSICHSKEFASLPPSQIVPTLADKGVYIASESSFYRILHQEKEQNHRGRAQKPRKIGRPKSHLATRSCQVWTWDVTWLKSPVKGIFFYLYMIIDIYSRKIVGWEVWEDECSEKAVSLVQKAVLKENCIGELDVLHADNGAIQKSSTLRVKLESLGVEASYSRPRVSDDNAYSESLFRTFKYRPDFPFKGFVDIEAARQWVFHFVHWYNNHHKHSGIKFVTPNEKHNGMDIVILENRKKVYESARAKNPSRWSQGTRCWEPVVEVHLNKPKEEESIRLIA